MSYFRIAVAFCFCVLSIASSLFAGSVRRQEFGGHLYLFVNEPLTWIEASGEAQRYFAHLAIIESASENDFLYTNLLAQGVATIAPDGGGARYAWLGASDAAAEGSWFWANNTAVSAGYTNWGSGVYGSEPDNYQGAQNYMALGLEAWPTNYPGAMGYASQWNDLNGTNRLAYIIEFESPVNDSDGDGLLDWEEFVADTDPNSAQSDLMLDISMKTTSKTASISWDASPNCMYRLQQSDKPDGTNWMSVFETNGISGTTTYPVNPSNSPTFYMLQVER